MRFLSCVLLSALCIIAAAGDAPAVVDGPRDGNPRLGGEFLLPYDTSRFDPARRRGTLRYFEDTPKGLNPLLDNSANTSAVHNLCNGSLCTRPPWAPEQWMAELAESAVISDDYRTYTFRIRPGLVWQRPTLAAQPEFAWLDRDYPLTSADFRFMLDTILNPQVDCPQQRTYYEDIASVETPDAQTLVIHWKKKVYTSLDASLGLSPLPKHIYGANRDGTPIAAESFGPRFNKHWFDEAKGVVGVGPYRLVEWTDDKRARFERNPAYFGVPYHFDAIEWNLETKDPAPQLVAFKNGQVHFDGLTPLLYKSEILDKGEPRFAAYDATNPKAGRAGELGWERVASMSFSYLGWNMRRPPFDDKLVRQAMSHAFPKRQIIRDIFMGLGQPVSSDVHPSSQYCNRDLKPYDFDLKKSAALLAQAGWTDSDGDGLLDKEIGGKRVTFSFTIKYVTHNPEWDNALQVYRNELRKIGIDLKPMTVEWKELLRVYEDKDFEAVVGGWRMSFDIDYFQLWHSSQADVQAGSNHCGFKNARVDELAVKLRETFETPARIAIVKEIQAILHEEQPYTFFRSGEGIFVWQNQPPPGSSAKDRYLEGVTEGLDKLNPLTSRSPVYWRLRN